MKKILFLAMAICLVFMTACTDSGKEAEPISTPEPPPVVTPTPEPTPTATPEPTPESTPTIELPPVETTYNPAADLNSDGHVDKAEWEKWVAAHPEDTNKDLVISDAEKEAANPSKPSGGNTQKPADTQKPSGGNTSKPTNPPATSKPSGGGNTSKPTTPPAEKPPVETPPANDDTFFDGSGGFGGTGMTPEEKEAWDNAGGAPGLSQ